MENQMVRKSNHLIEATYKLSTVEQKIILFLASTISSADEAFKSYSLRIKTFQSFIGNVSSNYERMEEVILALKEKNLRIVYNNEEGKRVVLNVGWLSSSKYTEGGGVIELRFDPDLKPFLLQLKSRFTKYRLKNIVQLRSQFSIRIYELLKQYETLGKRLFAVSELREILGIDESQYRQYTDFRKRVILVAQSELAEKTDISFEFEEIKTGHSVGQIRFIIKTNSQAEAQFVEAETIQGIPLPVKEEPPRDENLERLIATLPPDYQTKEAIRKLLVRWFEEKGFDYVARNIEYANEGSNAVNPMANVGKGSNYRNYLAKSLKGDFGLAYQEDREEAKKREESAKQKALAAANAEKQRLEQDQHEKENRDRARVYQQSLTPDGLEQLRTEALSRLPPQQQELVNRGTTGSEMLVKLMMDKITLERIKVA